MSLFFEVLESLSEQIYRPNQLKPSEIQEEAQNAAYGGGRFNIQSSSYRLRVAKVTPKKSGQFVAFWEKDRFNVNQAYSFQEAPTFLIVVVYQDQNLFGQFVFPKEELLKQGILRDEKIKGKMAIRVYPPWDLATSKQALKSQEWQSSYFVETSSLGDSDRTKLLRLYQL